MTPWNPTPSPRPSLHLADRWRRLPRWAVGSVAGVVGLVLGLSTGGGAAEPTETPEYQAVAGTLRTVEQERDKLADRAESAEDEVTESAEELEQVRADLSDLEGQVAALTTASKDVETRQAALDERESAVQAREDALAAAEEAAAAAKAAPVVAPAPTPAPKPAPAPAAPAPAPAQSAFKNCTAARDAGAAPVRRGDPGYAPHLDRDGDGVGCE